jgi:hypothetical protein
MDIRNQLKIISAVIRDTTTKLGVIARKRRAIVSEIRQGEEQKQIDNIRKQIGL